MDDLTEVMLRSALDMAEVLNADAVLAFVDNERILNLIDEIYKNRIIIATSKENLFKHAGEKGYKAIKLSFVKMDSFARIEKVLAMANSFGYLNEGDTVVLVYNESDDMDTIQVRKIRSSDMTEFYRLLTNMKGIDHAVFDAILETAIELGREGRDGQRVGALFVLGDAEDVLKRSTQLSYNPFERHPLTIYDKQMKEMLKEYSRLDGAFVISGKGEVLAAHRLLEISKEDLEIPKGLGARHTAAASITKLTDAIAIVVSKSSGLIRIFKDGRIIFEIDPHKS
ncbi:MAG: diadenylate cyclase [Candidatus Hydrothermarchaeota archaeon]